MWKEKIVNLCIPKDIIQKILNGKYPWQLKIIIFLMDISRMFRYYIKYNGSFKGLKNIEGLEEYNIPKESFDGNLKKDGISGYFRLKNASDFIIPSVESAIAYFDEIILVENGSTDDTVEKCKYLQEKYPEKVKFYRYTPEVYKLFSEEFKNCPENSVHNFAYMSNYTLSKVNYKYAMKLDDDQILVEKNFKKILESIKILGLKNFILTPLINIQINNNTFVLGGDNFRSTFAGLFSDIGIHPVSPRIYFHSNGKTEGYVHNYFSKIGPITFLHLKLLKPGKGFNNYDKNGLNYLENNYKSNHFIPLNQEYIKILNQYGIKS